MKKIGKQTFIFEKYPYLIGSYSIVGPKEGKGNFAQYFDEVLKDDTYGQKSYEKAERKLFLTAVERAMGSCGLDRDQIDVLLGGDLMNQIISSNFTARQLQLPFLGLFGACSTMAESLIVGSMILDGGFANNVACVTGSHFSSAEKQFRYPLELGTQRPPTSQWTVTGAGCSILSTTKSSIRITHATIGKVVDWDVTDANNMGGAMAPACLEPISTFFQDTNTTPDDYDLILTGDLGKLGSEVLRDLLEYRGYKTSTNYADCGQMMFTNDQKVFQGGSGCGCIATVLNSYVVQRMRLGKLKNVIIVGTGALMSTVSSQQGDSIPGIAHLVVLKAEK